MSKNVLIDTLSLFLPDSVLEWFDVVKVNKTDTDIKVFLEEKNIPPITEKERGKKVMTKGFGNISVNDFPIRGRRSTLIFKRRYWQVEGEDKYLKRDIELTEDNTKLEKEFATFLKE